MLCGRHSDPLVSVLESDRAVWVRVPAGALRCVLMLGQNTLLSKCLSSSRCINGCRRIVGTNRQNI